MKTQTKTLGLMALTAIALSLTSCKETKKEEQATTPTNVSNSSTYIDHYMSLKDALVGDDSVSASIHAKTLANSVQELDVTSYELKDERNFVLTVKKVAKNASQIPNADIALQRSLFEAITNDMINLIKITGASSIVYVQYCPMYEQGQGGYWLSQNEAVKNPLFGSMMLNCGRVTDTLK
jgi:hypothetical protein